MAIARAAACDRRRFGVLLAVVVMLVVGPLGSVAIGETDAPGLLLSLDVATGREQWRAETPPVFAVTDVSKRTVAGRGFDCSSGGFRTVAYRTADGHRRWGKPASGEGRAFGADAAGQGADRTGVVVVSLDREVQGLDAKSGTVRWRVGVPPFSTVEVTSDRVYVGEYRKHNGRARLQALDRATGRVRWSSQTSRPVFQTQTTQAGPTVVATTIVRDNTYPINDEVHVLDANSGRELWTTTEPPLAVAGSIVGLYRSASATAPAAIDVRDARTGKPLWEHATDSRGATESSGVLVVQDATTISAFEARTGQLRWTHPAGDSPTMSVGAGLVAVASDRNELAALDLQTGVERWHAALPGDQFTNTNAVVIGRDGVYVARGCAPTD